MSPAVIFQVHLVLGYVPWLLCFGTYVWPRLKAMDEIAAQRAIATLHSFRFFGLVFLLPGVVGPNLPGNAVPVGPAALNQGFVGGLHAFGFRPALL